jgi:chromosome segregation ATPase
MRSFFAYATIAALMAPAAVLAQSAQSPALTPVERARQHELQTARDEFLQGIENDRGQIADNTEVLRSASHRIEVSPPIFRQALAALDDQIESLQLQKVSQQARADAIRAAIKGITDEADKKADTDQAVVELAKVADARVQALEMLKSAPAGAIAAKDIADTESAVAEAKAQVFLRRDSVFSASGGDIVNELNKELVDLEIAQGDCNAKLQFLEAQANDMLRATGNADQLEESEKKLADDEASAERLQEKLEELRLDSLMANPATSAPSP